MGKTVTIELETPIALPSGLISEVILREPNFGEYMGLGDPFTVHYSKEGQAFPVEHQDVIKSYLRTCVVKPENPVLLNGASFRDAIRVKDAFLGFFLLPTSVPGEAAVGPSSTSPGNSASPETEAFKPTLSIG